MRNRRISSLATPLAFHDWVAATGKLVCLPNGSFEQPLFAEQWVPVIPVELLDLLVQTLKPVVGQRAEQVFTSDSIARERTAAELAREQLNAVGFRGGVPVTSEILKSNDARVQLTEVEKQQILDIAAEADGSAKPVIEKRELLMPRVAVSHQGYCGWLMTQALFHDEHRKLRWELSKYSVLRGLSAPHFALTHQPTMDTPEDRNALGRIREFLTRWELASMPAPFVFEIEGPLVNCPVGMVAAMRPNAVVSVFPKNAKLPDREDLRKLLDRGPEGESVSHLSEWLDLVANNTQSEKTVAWYADLYRVQHYFHALRDRHPAVEQGSKRRAIEAIIAYVRGITPRDVTKGVLDGFTQAVNQIGGLIYGHQADTCQDRQA